MGERKARAVLSRVSDRRDKKVRHVTPTPRSLDASYRSELLFFLNQESCGVRFGVSLLEVIHALGGERGRNWCARHALMASHPVVQAPTFHAIQHSTARHSRCSKSDGSTYVCVESLNNVDITVNL